jgi:thioredoxin-related protein
MKTIVSFLIGLFMGVTPAFAGNEEGGIRWMTFDEVQVAMQKEPRRVFMDVYTDWCGWCKVMDRKTFTSPEAAAYINKNFYPVKFNAETDQPIRFVGKVWERVEGSKTNKLAVELLRGQLSYPSTVIMEPGFQQVQAIPGYLDVPTLEAILTYIVEGHGTGPKAVPFPEYQKAHKQQWTSVAQ